MTACVQRLYTRQLAQYDLDSVIEKKFLKILPEIGNKSPG